MTVRARLTLWYGGTLLLIVLASTLGVFIFVRAELLGQVQHEVDEAYENVEATCRHDPSEVYELEKHGRLAYFEVREGQRVIHRTARWPEVEQPEGRIYRLKRGKSGRFEIAAAYDETPARNAVRTVGLVVALGLPVTALLALAGGYVLAGRLLSPVGVMATKAREISAERFAERLPVGNPGDEFGRLATVFNETLSRLESSFQQLRRFTADASHELRTPLTAIRTVGEVALQQGKGADFYRDVIGSILEEVDRLSHLVDNLLFLTRADAGVIRPVRERVDLTEVAKATVDLLRVLAEEKNQTLHLEGEAGLAVLADPGLLRQAVMNLIDNAIKYTPVRGEICVRVTRQPKGRGSIEVMDTGPGIPEVARARLFERFHRVDAARSRDDGGAGLGLAIARWAVEANQGTIEFESQERAGSTFRIVLPILSN